MSISGAAEPSPPPPSPGESPSDTRTVATCPLVVWLLVQLAALLVAAARVPLAAAYPRAGEQLAVYLLLGTQIVAAAALMPWLLRGWRTSVLAAACCWPLLAMAAALSTVPRAQAIAAGAFVTAWLAALSVGRAAAPSHRLACVISAVASTLAAGGPLLWYLRVEFASAGESAAGAAWQYGPVLSAFSLASGDAASASMWLVPLALTALGGAVWSAKRWRAVRGSRQDVG